MSIVVEEGSAANRVRARSRKVDSACHRELQPQRDRPLPGLRPVPDRQAAGQEPGASGAGPARALHRGRPARHRDRAHRRPSRSAGPARRVAARAARRSRRHPRPGGPTGRPAGRPARRPLPRPGPRRHRPHRLQAARRAPRLLRPADAQPGVLPPPGRHRHAARDRRRAPSGSPSARWRASPARSARRSGAAAPSSWSTSPTVRRVGCCPPWPSSCRPSRRTSPARSSGSAPPPTTPPAARWPTG